MISKLDPFVILECNITTIQKCILKLNKIIYEESKIVNELLLEISDSVESILKILPELKK